MNPINPRDHEKAAEIIGREYDTPSHLAHAIAEAMSVVRDEAIREAEPRLEVVEIALARLAVKSMRAWRFSMADGVASVAGIQPEHREALEAIGWRPGGACVLCGRKWNIRNADGCPDCQ